MRRQALADILGVALMATNALAVEIYVSPTGSDMNPGSATRPFATLSRAQAEVRKALRKHGASRPVAVWLRGGSYYLAETLVLTAEDSGADGAPVVWQACPGETPVVSGGRRLDLKWDPWRDGILKTSVPAGTDADQLFVNGRRQVLARYPNFDPRERILNGYAPDAFSRERAARWIDPAGGFIHALHGHEWGGFIYRITGKDKEGNVTYEGGWQNNRQTGMHPRYRYVENILEELDTAGEWFLDRSNNILYFYPPGGTDLGAALIEVAVLRHLVEFRGSEQQPVRFVQFKGILFRHARRTFMETREPLLRSDWTTYRGGAVFFNGAEDCGLDECTLDQVGGHGVFVNNYNRRVSIRGCEIDQAGANSVAFVGDPAAVRSPLFEYAQTLPLDKLDLTAGPKTQNFPADCLVEDCLLSDNGRVEKQTAGVQISMSARITVRHCSIYGSPRAGINIGDGCWGGHVVEFCDVFDTVKETGDHGGFNSWGRDRYWVPNVGQVNERVKGSPALPLLDVVEPITLRNSRWKCDHGWDIDLDDGSSNYRICNNVCLRGGLKLREGFNRTVTNNVMASFHPHVWFEKSGDVVSHNIITGGYEPIGMPREWGSAVDSNLFATAGELAKAQGMGLDKNSLAGDPMFVDIGRGNYSVREGSPALKLGFSNFPMDRFGVTSPRLKAKAKTPFAAPASQSEASAAEIPGPPRDPRQTVWLGARVKNVTTLGERSAAGLPGLVGVLVQEVPAGSPAAGFGLRSMDVIKGVGSAQADDIDVLERLYYESVPGAGLELAVVRGQEERKVSVRRGEEVFLPVRLAGFGGTKSAAMSADRAFVGAWTDPKTTLEWLSVKVPRPGTYEVLITLGCDGAGNAGSTYDVAIGDANVRGTVPDTGGWETWTTASLGSIALQSGGPISASIRPTNMKGRAVMNVRSLLLAPK